MKNIAIIILILICTACKAQTIYPIDTPYESIIGNNYYVKDIENHYDNIVGVWRWEEGNDSFEITLQEFEMFPDYIVPTIYWDKIFGKYTYHENGQIIVDITSIEPTPNLKLSLAFKTPMKYSVVIQDPISETNKIGEFKLINENTATLRLWNSEGVKLGYGNGQEFALPTSITLTKQ